MEDWIVCSGFSAFFLMLFGLIAFMRFLSYRETLALAERGLARPDRAHGDGKGSLRWGIVITAMGLALCLGLWPLGFLINGRGGFPFGFGPWMLAGLLPMFFGLGLILVYVLTREGKKPEDKAKAPEVVEPPKAE